MDRRTRELVDVAARAVARETATGAVGSRQPRFDDAPRSGWGAVLGFAQGVELAERPYAADSRARDSWLRAVWRLEPRLAGILNSVTALDANRGWTLTGGRNQVLRYTAVLHDADGGEGWRALLRKLSLSFWATDMGALAEVGRDGGPRHGQNGGPLRGLYHLDSARCRLTGRPAEPLEYYPVGGGMQTWGPDDYLRCASMPSDDEAFHGLGTSAVSRAVELVRVLYAVMQHDQEQLGARAPRGLLLLKGISEGQWEDSLAARQQALDGLERRYYGGVQVLASSGMEEIDAKLVALSQLPLGFDAKTFLDLTMYGYALCFGYDPSEFWPVQFGSLGRGTESEMQHRKATAKGGLEFALGFQERLQDELPPTLSFAFEQRDEAAEMAQCTLAGAKANVIRQVYLAGLDQGAPLISREEARRLLARERIIPPEWTEAEEDLAVTDTEDVEVERLLACPEVQRARLRWPQEPIVRYGWPSGQLRTLWEARQ